MLQLYLSMLTVVAVLFAVYWTMRDSRDGASDGSRPNGSHPAANTGGGGTGAPHPGNASGESGGADGSGNADGQNGGQATGPEGKDGRESGSNGSSGGGTVTLSFVGDILLSGSVETRMEREGYGYPYAKSADFLKKPDLLAGNLETPVTTRGEPAEHKQYVFKSSPKALPALKAAGFDLVTLANNHTLDQGVEGLRDTIRHLNDAGIPNVGAGNNEAEAFKPVVLEKGGIRVAYIGLTHVVPEVSWKAGPNTPGLAETYDTTRAVKAIGEASKQADLVVVLVHWGVERADRPNSLQKRDAHAFIDAGADLVIGCHPHVLQGFETYKGKWISYSLGNYIFNSTRTEKTKDTGVLDAVCAKDGRCRLKFHPMRSEASQPAPLAGEQAAALLKRLSGLSLNASVDKNGFVQPRR
ncbi:CapA family protein [Paenibacillus humicola]|uniref:CapA family protein n=1 Tax=Paenibacillus humicola TaxID=3110540 RepID=UPI00237A75F4|nr:CapA family protein [Paenibacillus humicola]